MGEQFRTRSLGLSWQTTPFSILECSGASPQVQYTSDPQIVYTIDYRNDLSTPVKTTNGQITWNPLGSDPTSGGAYSIAADPHSVSRVLVGSYSQLFFSSDGGASFAARATALSGNGMAVGGAFYDGSLILVGTNDGLLVSTTGGTSFVLQNYPGIPASESIVSFAAAKTGSTIRLYCVTLGAGQVYAGITGADHSGYKGVYTMDWGSGVWTKRVTGINANDHPFFVALNPSDINVAYLGGGSVNGVPIIYKTIDGGLHWQSVFLTTNNQNIATGWSGAGGDRTWGYGEIVFGLGVSPLDSNKVAFTDYGFTHISTDGGISWRQCYVDPSTQNPPGANTPTGRAYKSVGLENTSCWWVSWITPQILWGSYSDIRGIRSTDAGQSWSFDYSGHTANSSYQTVVHPTSGVVYMASSSVHDIYQSTHLTDSSLDSGTGNVMFSADQGHTWQALGNLGKPVVSVALDPTNSNRIYAAVVNSSTGGIYVCNAIGLGPLATWTHLPNPPRTQGHPFNIKVLNDGVIVCTFSGRRAGSPINFTASSGVFISSDGGQTWIDRSSPDMQYWTMDVTIDPSSPTQQVWMACVFAGWGGQANNRSGLFRSVDRGVTWTKIFNDVRVGSCTFNPWKPGELWVTTETHGLWYCADCRIASPSFVPVSSYPFRQPERVFFNPGRKNEIWVSSFGNGLRVGYLPTLISR